MNCRIHTRRNFKEMPERAQGISEQILEQKKRKPEEYHNKLPEQFQKDVKKMGDIFFNKFVS